MDPCRHYRIVSRERPPRRCRVRAFSYTDAARQAARRLYGRRLGLVVQRVTGATGAAGAFQAYRPVPTGGYAAVGAPFEVLAAHPQGHPMTPRWLVSLMLPLMLLGLAPAVTAYALMEQPDLVVFVEAHDVTICDRDAARRALWRACWAALRGCTPRDPRDRWYALVCALQPCILKDVYVCCLEGVWYTTPDT